MIDREMEARLVKAAQAGDEKATNALVNAHLPLIRSIARRMGRLLDEEDAVSYGVIGFLEGLPRYDLDSGFRVNTFIRHYIAEGVRSASHKAPIVKITRGKEVAGGLRAIAEMKQRQETVTPETLAAKTGFCSKVAKSIIEKHAHTRPNTYQSINDALDLEDDRPHPDHHIEMDQRRALLEKAKSCLTDRERHIFETRTAARDEVLTLDDLGKVYGVTRERIRQIEMKALNKVQRQLAFMGLPRVDLRAD